MRNIFLSIGLIFGAKPIYAGVLINGNQINPASSVSLASGTFSGTLSVGGTFTPKGALVVVGSATVQGASFFQGNIGIGGAPNSNALHVQGNADVSGSFGVGTASPPNKFSVVGDGSNPPFSWTRGGGGDQPGFLYSDGTGFGPADSSLFNNGVYINSKSSYTAFYVNAAERMRLNASGSLGIRTTSPNTAVEISSNATLSDAPQLRVSGVNTLQRLNIGYDTTSDYGWIQAVKAGTANEPLALQPSGASVLVGRITDDGNSSGLEVLSANASISLSSSTASGAQYGVLSYGSGVNNSFTIFAQAGHAMALGSNGSTQVLLPVGGTTTGSALCLDGSHHLGVCTSVVGAGGTCTCTAN